MAQAVTDAAFHLRANVVRIDRHAAIHRAPDLLDPERPVVAARDLGDLRHIAVEGLVHRHAAPAPGRRGPAPARLVGGQFQHRTPAGVAGQQFQPQVQRVASRRLRRPVDHGLHGIGGVAVADRTPPQHRYADADIMDVAPEIGDRIGRIRDAFDRASVDALRADQPGKRGAGEDRLADHAMIPGDQPARRVDAGPHPMQVHRPVIAAADIVLAGIDQLDRLRPSPGPGNGGGFRRVMPVIDRPPAERPAGP